MNKETAKLLKIGDEVVALKPGISAGTKYPEGHVGFVTFKPSETIIVVGTGAGQVTEWIDLADWDAVKSPKKVQQLHPEIEFVSDFLKKHEYDEIANFDQFRFKHISSGTVDLPVVDGVDNLERTETFNLFMDGSLNLHFRFQNEAEEPKIYTLPFESILREIRKIRGKEVTSNVLETSIQKIEY